jgi:hypothetical protein
MNSNSVDAMNVIASLRAAEDPDLKAIQWVFESTASTNLILVLGAIEDQLSRIAERLEMKL